MWRGDEHVGEWKIRSLSLSLPVETAMVIFMESCYRAGKQQEERSSANEIKTQSRDF